jgi:hypothetical protein
MTGLHEVMALLHEDDRSAGARLSRSAALLRGLGRVGHGCAQRIADPSNACAGFNWSRVNT